MPKSKSLGSPKFPPPAPIEFAGQWVAWNKDRTTIVANGREFAAVYDAALAAGHSDAAFQHVRRRNVRFIGMT